MAPKSNVDKAEGNLESKKMSKIVLLSNGADSYYTVGSHRINHVIKICFGTYQGHLNKAGAKTEDRAPATQASSSRELVCPIKLMACGL